MRRKEKQTIMRKTGSKNKRSDSCSAETSKLLKNWARKQLKQPHCTQKNESAMYKINIYIYIRVIRTTSSSKHEATQKGQKDRVR